MKTLTNSCPQIKDEKSALQIDTSEKLVETDQEVFPTNSPKNNPAIRRNNWINNKDNYSLIYHNNNKLTKFIWKKSKF